MALSNKGNIAINGTEYKVQSLKINYKSLTSQDSGKTDDGKMHLFFIYNRQREISVTLPPSSAENITSILSKIQGKIYSLTYFDAIENQELTIECYTLDSSASLYSGVLLDGLWNGITFKATEVAGELV